MPTQVAGSESLADLAHATPILRVDDLDKSLGYYTGPLGFRTDWRVQGFASVSRGRCSLMLSEGEQGHAGTWLWIGLNDVEQLFAELQRSGARIRQGPTNFPWGSLEIQVTDLDGHVLRFASDGRKDSPMGPWMDAEGRLWQIAGQGEARSPADR